MRNLCARAWTFAVVAAALAAVAAPPAAAAAPRRLAMATTATTTTATTTTATTTTAATTVAVRGQASTAAYGPNTATKITLPRPKGAKTGDLLIATIGFGRNGATAQPVLTAPARWDLVMRTDSGVADALAVYRHVLVAGEKNFVWLPNVAVGGVASIVAVTGADPDRPVDVSAGLAATGPTRQIATASVTTSTAGSLLLAAYYGYNAAGRKTTWSAPSGMSELADAANAGRSASLANAGQPVAGPSGQKSATASMAQDRAVAVLLALRPPAPPPTGPVPLIVDLDMFSDADDAGALATAFALQRAGETQVLAVMLNTRTSRPSVAVDSWRCAAAIARYYGAGSTPIASAAPSNGTATSTPDWAGPCADTTGPVAPPADAVTTYRQVLAAQPDGSVVIASTGYLANLAGLLVSPPDAASSLTGTELVARKVRLLVAMAGGYPNAASETNIIGNVPAAQAVASGWPTRIEWDGYEIGDAVHTGSTVSTTHPPGSPLRVAYEAFVGPRNWIYSYDLTAVYRAVRPADPSMARTGPGRNVISNTGANTFSTGQSGDQYYLNLLNATGLSGAIDALLSAVPPAPGPSDDFSSGVIGPAWTVGQNGSSVTASDGLLTITHPAGDWTTGSLQSSSPYDQTGRSVQLQLVRAANSGAGGTTYGETSIIIRQDATHYAEFYVAGGSLTAWYNGGSGGMNLTPSWPTYSATGQQWLRFRESAGTLSWEYAAAAGGPWVVLASTSSQFPTTAVRLQLIAGSNNTAEDIARFDNVSIY